MPTTLTKKRRIDGLCSRALGGVLMPLAVLVAAAATAPALRAQTYRLLYSFQCGTDGSNPYGGLVRDASGNLYGTTYLGGSLGDGVVFRLAPSGALTVLHAFAGSPTDDVSPIATMVRDGAGNLYGTTGTGGLYNYGTVFKIAPGGTETLLHREADKVIAEFIDLQTQLQARRDADVLSWAHEAEDAP